MCEVGSVAGCFPTDHYVRPAHTGSSLAQFEQRAAAIPISADLSPALRRFGRKNSLARSLHFCRSQMAGCNLLSNKSVRELRGLNTGNPK